ncbi:MAG: TauD/TfdA family dioxygenase [Myxococcota bacterium]
MAQRLDVVPLDAPLGAEIVGVDPGARLSGEAVDAIASALHRHHALVFRGPSTPRPSARLVEFAQRFGEVFRFYEEGTEPGFPEILCISNVEQDGRPIGITGTMELPWHTDYGNHPLPAKESFLEAVEVPGGEAAATSFVDMYDAWETLSAPLRRAIDGRCALHRVKTEYDLDDAINRKSQAQRNAIQTAHPIAVRHPDTGRVALYVSPVESTEIVGLPDDEAREIFAAIFAHVLRPEKIYRHAWTRGDLVVFDAIGTMHHREAFAADQRRRMKQLSTRCPAPPAAA